MHLYTKLALTVATVLLTPIPRWSKKYFVSSDEEMQVQIKKTVDALSSITEKQPAHWHTFFMCAYAVVYTRHTPERFVRVVDFQNALGYLVYGDMFKLHPDISQ